MVLIAATLSTLFSARFDPLGQLGDYPAARSCPPRTLRHLGVVLVHGCQTLSAKPDAGLLAVRD